MTDTDWLVSHGVRVALVLLLAFAASKAAKVAVRRVRSRLEGSESLTQAHTLQRVATIAQALSSAARVVIWTVAVLLILGEIGLDIGPLVAGAGIAGVALGFGAQSLVRDFLSGFFILLENQFGVGHLVEMRTTGGDVSGHVESLSLRVTAVRAFDGTLYVVPNGNVQLVGNRSRGWGRAIVDVPVARGVDLEQVGSVLEELCVELEHEPPFEGWLLGRPTVLGVEGMRDDVVDFRVVAETRSSRRPDVERELRRHISLRLDERGIERPASLGSLLQNPRRD